MKVLLLSAYDAASHSRWRQGLVAQFEMHEWTQLFLPARYFNWRIRGNSLTWAFSEREKLSQHYDLLIVTSMVDLSSLRGFIPNLGQIPTLVYFHENQFAYPASDQQHKSVEPQMVNLYTALCADRLVFNSQFNRQSFFRGVGDLLKKLPDAVPEGVVEHLQARAECIPVPLDSTCFVESVRSPLDTESTHFHLLWNHRWEYDKGPDKLFSALQKVFSAGRLPPQTSIKCHIVGQQFRQSPKVFEDIRQLLEQHNALGEWGYIASQCVYRDLLSSSHAVVSTALHDFQGLAVLEAVAAGCEPLVPARQAYPEWFGAEACYDSDLEHPHREAESLAQAILARVEAWRLGQPSNAHWRQSLEGMAWPQLKLQYQAVFDDLLGQ